MIKSIFRERIYALSFFLFLILLVASILFPTTFFTFRNFSQILLNLSVETIVAVGMMLLLISGVFDLSVGSMTAFSACLAAYLMYFLHIPIVFSILIAILVCVFLGWINGYLIAYQHINPMIQTLAMMGIVRGLALLFSGSGIQDLPYWFNAIGQSKLLGIQMPVWYMLSIVLIISFLSQRSVFFRKFYYIGGNEKAAFLSGIQVNKIKCIGFMVSAGLAALAGIFMASRLGAALPTMGRGLELKVITAAILGGASLTGGSGKIPGVLLGTLFMGIISNIMVIARVSGYWQEIILGLILIVTLWLDQYFQKNQIPSK
jgi:ribose transport system permease protein